MIKLIFDDLVWRESGPALILTNEGLQKMEVMVCGL